LFLLYKIKFTINNHEHYLKISNCYNDFIEIEDKLNTIISNLKEDKLDLSYVSLNLKV
jgi:hypothetical protein